MSNCNSWNESWYGFQHFQQDDKWRCQEIKNVLSRKVFLASEENCLFNCSMQSWSCHVCFWINSNRAILFRFNAETVTCLFPEDSQFNVDSAKSSSEGFTVSITFTMTDGRESSASQSNAIDTITTHYKLRKFSIYLLVFVVASSGATTTKVRWEMLCSKKK